MINIAMLEFLGKLTALQIIKPARHTNFMKNIKCENLLEKVL